MLWPFVIIIFKYCYAVVGLSVGVSANASDFFIGLVNMAILLCLILIVPFFCSKFSPVKVTSVLSGMANSVAMGGATAVGMVATSIATKGMSQGSNNVANMIGAISKNAGGGIGDGINKANEYNNL